MGRVLLAHLVIVVCALVLFCTTTCYSHVYVSVVGLCCYVILVSCQKLVLQRLATAMVSVTPQRAHALAFLAIPVPTADSVTARMRLRGLMSQWPTTLRISPLCVQTRCARRILMSACSASHCCSCCRVCVMTAVGSVAASMAGLAVLASG